jgi:phage terminase large subunit-like protein
MLELIRGGYIPGYDPFRDAGDCTFDEAAAAKAVSFFPEYLVHRIGKLAAKPYVLENHEAAIVANLFGWKRPNGKRRYREFLLYIPKKNSKTTFAAGLALLLLYLDNEPGKEIYCAAADEIQARYLFDTAAFMVQEDEDLKARAGNGGEVYKRAIMVDGQHVFRVMTSKAGTKHGPNIHGLFLDELHVLQEELVNTLTRGTAARAQPLTGYLTTAPVMGESICNDIYERACAVRDGRQHDPAFLPAIFEATTADDWTKPETWFKANPNLGKSIPVDYFEAEVAKAIANPRLQNNFKRLHLNMRTEQLDRWLDVGKWMECDPAPNPKAWRDEALERYTGQACFGGFDIGQTSDLTDLELIFPEDNGLWTTLGFRWLPVDGTWRNSPNASSYMTWADMGFIKMTPGEVADYSLICSDIIAVMEKYGVQEIAADTSFQGSHLCQMLRDEGGVEIFSFPQNWTHMTEPCKELEARILSRRIRHGGDPVMRWAVGNVTTQENADGTRFRPTKPSRHLKIDPVVALIMAISRTITHETEGGDYYARGAETGKHFWEREAAPAAPAPEGTP